MLPQLVLLMAIVVGVSLMGLVRRRDPGQRGYLLVVAGVLLLCVMALLRVDRFVSVVALSLGMLVVVMPWALDLLVRACFGRERLAWAVWLAGVRVMLMPGAGLSRQQEILHGLAVLERRGVDGALDHFRKLVRESEDETELRVLHEQIVSMLLYGQRWNEGIAHYEARFPPGYAAQRPPLALGLLRAYGESGKLDRAAALLRGIEELLGRDPRAGGVVSQARLTFLAYAGETGPVDAALTKERRRRLGLSEASGALFRGIALTRAGQPDAAQEQLRRVEDVARSRDDRVVQASRAAIAALPGMVIELEPALSEYADTVAQRLEAFLQATPTVRRTGPLRVTPLLLAALLGGYLLVLAVGGGAFGLLRTGAASGELVRAGSWGRLVTGLLVQIDPIDLLLSIYGVWLAGPLVERIYGRGRLLLVSVGAGAAGLAAAVAVGPQPALALAGPSLMTSGVVMAALWILVSPRTRLPRASRRVLALPLLLMLAAMAVSIPRTHGLSTSPVGLAAAGLLGALLVGIGGPRGAMAQVLRGLAGLVAIAAPVGAVLVALEDPEAMLGARRVARAADGVALQSPPNFEVIAEARSDDEGEPWPLLPGLRDSLAEQVGQRVQVVVTAPASAGTDGPSALLRIAPDLAHDLDEARGEAPAAWQEAYRERMGEAALAELRTTVVRRNGRDVGLVIERVLSEGPQGRSVVLLAAPPQALVQAPMLYAELLAGAERTEPSL